MMNDKKLAELLQAIRLLNSLDAHTWQVLGARHGATLQEIEKKISTALQEVQDNTGSLEAVQCTRFVAVLNQEEYDIEHLGHVILALAPLFTTTKLVPYGIESVAFEFVLEHEETHHTVIAAKARLRHYVADLNIFRQWMHKEYTMYKRGKRQ